MKIIDVSEHQGRIDWETVKGKVDGVMIRAGYGKNNIDNQFVRNISECNRLGIPCGVYWFSYAYTAEMAAKEAEYCLAAIKPYRVELPVAFDFEYDSVAYFERHKVWMLGIGTELVNAFCGAVEAAGYYAMVYANPDFLATRFGDISAYDLWLAEWPRKAPEDLSKPPRPCGIWQWGVSTIPGITGSVDTNEGYKEYPTIIGCAGLNHLTAPEPTAPEPATIICPCCGEKITIRVEK